MDYLELKSILAEQKEDFLNKEESETDNKNIKIIPAYKFQNELNKIL